MRRNCRYALLGSSVSLSTYAGCQVWSESYDRNLDDDLFTVQGEIATAVVAALKMSLLAEGAPKAAGTWKARSARDPAGADRPRITG